MREFVAAGGELIIHGAPHSKNSPTPELINVHHHRLYMVLVSVSQQFYRNPAKGFRTTAF